MGGSGGPPAPVDPSVDHVIHAVEALGHPLIVGHGDDGRGAPGTSVPRAPSGGWASGIARGKVRLGAVLQEFHRRGRIRRQHVLTMWGEQRFRILPLRWARRRRAGDPGG